MAGKPSVWTGVRLPAAPQKLYFMLKKWLSSVFFFFFYALMSLNAQVAINTDGALPDNSAILDINAPDKGLLIPRVALTGTSDNTTIPSPATGLMIYNTQTTSDVVEGFYYYDGSQWQRLGNKAYHFENGLTDNGSGTVRFGGYLSQNTTLTFGFNNLAFNMDNTGQFTIQSAGTDMVIFENDGDVEFNKNIAVNEYVNFGDIFGSTGYGFRTRSGVLEYKKQGGEWSPFPDAVPANTEPIWWYRPVDSTFIRPQNNDNVRIYDDNEKYGFFYDGGTNQFGGFFRTQSAADTTAAVVGFSDIAGLQTYGYLGYSGNYTNPYGDLSLDGAAVYGKVDDKKRAAIFGRTTRDATVASIVGFSDVWISGYFYSRDIDERSQEHPALYGQLLVDVDKSGYQAAIESWAEYIAGTGNRGYTVGGYFSALGKGYSVSTGQDAIGVKIYAQSYGSNTVAFGQSVTVDSAETVIGTKIQAGTPGVTSAAYGLYSVGATDKGIGIIGIGSDAANFFSSGKGDGVIGFSDNGYGVLGYFDDNSTEIRSEGVLGFSTEMANYFYHKELSANGDGQAAAIVERESDGNNSSSYYYMLANFGLQAVNYNADDYSFALGGYSYNNGYRTGGTFGGLIDYYNYDSTTTWGALGYASNGGSDYGAYWTSYGQGTGKNNFKSNVGFGSYSDFLGGWVKGEDYGLFVKGERTALYLDGKTYTNDLIMNLSGDRTVTYFSTSDKPVIYFSGVGELKNGKATITFDEKYKDIISDKYPVIVTVTPLGDCNGLHLISAKKSGFVVEENKGGRSNVKFTWIAMATRIEAEHSNTPGEFLDKDFDKNLDDFMVNENINQAGKAMYMENGEIKFGKIEKQRANTTGRKVKRSYKKENLQSKKKFESKPQRHQISQQ